jgi:hypothetical protein
MKAHGSRSELAFVAALGLLLMGLLLARTPLLTPDSPHFAMAVDRHTYIYMAEHGAFSLHVAPYGWRIGLPLLVSALPMDPAAGFLVITFVSLWLTAVVVYYLVRQFGFPRSLAIVGMVMFLSLSWAVKVNLRDFWLTEPPAFLILTSAMLMLVCSRPVAAGGLMAAGVFFRESVLVLAPLFYTFRARRRWDRRAAVESVALVIPALLVLVGLRLAIPALNSDPGYVATLPPEIQSVVHGTVPNYNLPDVIQRNVSVRLDYVRTLHGVMVMAWTLSFSIYGFPVTLLAILGALANRRLFARIGLMLVVPWAQLLLATNNERLLVVAFPAAIVMAVTGTAYLMNRLNLTYVPFLVLMLFFFALNLVDTNTPVPAPALQVLGLVLSLAFFAACVRWLRDGPAHALGLRQSDNVP